MMDFGAQPPEVTSTLMYSGPGSAPLLSAAAEWSSLSASLESSAAEMRSVISGLGDVWQGPSSQQSRNKLTAHTTWLSNTAAMAAHTAGQAQAAATAHETAYAATVNPALIAYNRAELLTLSATNILGQNTAAIMANEAEYSEMWAQDAATMYGYQAQSAAATSALQAPAAPTGTISSILDQLLSQISLDPIGATLNGAMVSAAFLAAFIQGIPAMMAVSNGGSGFNPATAVPKLPTIQISPMVEPEGAVPVVPRSIGGMGGMGSAGRIGGLSVPSSWASSAAQAAAPTAARFVPYGGTQPAGGIPAVAMPPGGKVKDGEHRKPLPEYGQKLTVMPAHA